MFYQLPSNYSSATFTRKIPCIQSIYSKNMSGKLVWGVRLVRQNVRGFTTSEKRFIEKEAVEKIKKKQEYFQTQSNQHVPVHLITGKTHFYITTVLGILTLICTADSLYKIVKRG